jgi:GT2 family glycosyltransferase
MEIILVDDKSPEASSILELAKEYGAAYVRNESKEMESQPALCRNLGFEASTGEVIVFNDADMLLATNALESHVRYHMQIPNAAVCSQFWRIAYSKTALDALQEPDVNKLRTLGHSAIHDTSISWSEISDPHPSSNWWAFLSGQLSINRRDFEKIGRWDEKYTGWGAEDNDLGYRIHKAGMQTLFASDIRAFHIDHPITREDYAQKCRTALRNLKYMCEKYPEIEKEERVRQRLKELETLSNSELKNVTRQGTAGGGPISDSLSTRSL